MLEQMTKELPDCVLPESGSLIDPEYFVNEYLIRNGYFDDMQSLREENRELKRDRVLMEKEIRNLRSSLRQLDVCSPRSLPCILTGGPYRHPQESG
jgi:hypothetical protein